MKWTLTTLKRAVPLACAALFVAGAAQAALQDRDLNGDAVVDAFYDTDLDITWLRNANVNGQMNWDSAVAWADGFSFAGYDDWRLPASDECSGFNCTGSEMGHLWYIELGNVAHSLTNTGNFQNLQASYYWSGTENTSVAAWNFGVINGAQQAINKVVVSYAMAVRPGDVPVVPEPQTYALMLAGLGLLGAVARRRNG
jgi:hypothetical protein